MVTAEDQAIHLCNYYTRNETEDELQRAMICWIILNFKHLPNCPAIKTSIGTNSPNVSITYDKQLWAVHL